MEKYKSAKLSAFQTVDALVASNCDKLADLPEFETRSAAFAESLAAVVVVSRQREYANSAEMDSYKEVRALLEKQCLLVSRKLLIVADTTANEALRKDVRYTPSELMRMAKARLVDVAGLLIERGTKVLTDDSVTLLTKQELDKIGELLEEYSDTMHAYRNFQLKQRNDTRQIDEAFAAAQVAFEKLFLVLDLIVDSEPLLYQQLCDASRLIISRQTVSLRGLVAESKTEYPIKGVKMVIRKLGETVSSDLMISPEDMVKVTSAQGAFLVRNLPEGNYLLTASKVGYATTNVQFNVAPSETTKVNLLMEVS